MAKAKKTSEVESDVFNPYADIDDVMDDIEKSYGLMSSGMDKHEKRLSTGLLVLDLIMGKGIAGGGWYTIYGGESCCKSTVASTIVAHSVNSAVPIVQMWDYEGSSEPNYLENILMTQGVKVPVEEIFGIRNPQTSQWAIKPRVRYYSESIAEKFFDAVAKLQRYLPDKIKVGDDYFYVYNHTKDNIASFKGKYDKAFYQKSGKIRVPAQDSLPQALLIVDSYPAMLPEGQDVDDPGSAMAMQARMFSEQIKRIKGKMKSKRITVVGMNQLRDKPMVMYGSPVYEPCGQAVKFYCMGINTLVQTSSGMLYPNEIEGEKELPSVLGESGLEQPTVFAQMGISPIVEANTEYGYSVNGKPSHRVLALREGQLEFEWVKLKDLQLHGSGQYYLPIKIGAEIFNSTTQKLKYKPIQGEQALSLIHI